MAISTEEMRARQEAAQGGNTNIAQAIQEVSERAQILVREEIELAKAELSEKISTLVKGAAIGAAAGVFAIFGLLFLLGALAGFLAARAFKRGTPPTPEMAIDEAKRIRETVQSPHPEHTV